MVAVHQHLLKHVLYKNIFHEYSRFNANTFNIHLYIIILTVFYTFNEIIYLRRDVYEITFSTVSRYLLKHVNWFHSLRNSKTRTKCQIYIYEKKINENQELKIFTKSTLLT